MIKQKKTIKVVDKEFEFHMKKQDFLTSISETSENVYLLVSVS